MLVEYFMYCVASFQLQKICPNLWRMRYVAMQETMPGMLQPSCDGHGVLVWTENGGYWRLGLRRAGEPGSEIGSRGSWLSRIGWGGTGARGRPARCSGGLGKGRSRSRRRNRSEARHKHAIVSDNSRRSHSALSAA